MTAAIARGREGTCFFGGAFFFFFFFGGGGWRGGECRLQSGHTRSSICESHRRLSTLSRPPCFTATRMSRLSSWFTWSVLNVEAGKAAEEEEEEVVEEEEEEVVEEEEEEAEEGGVKAE